MKSTTSVKLLRLVWVIGLSLCWHLLPAQQLRPIASCCIGEEGRCTGSPYCTACKTCAYCQYCNSGGSCGVCAVIPPMYNSSHGNNSSSTHVTKGRNGNSRAGSTLVVVPDDIYSPYYLKSLVVTSQALNLRAGPGTSYPVLAKLARYDQLFFLAMAGEWVKVRVKSTLATGFVHYQYVAVLE